MLKPWFIIPHHSSQTIHHHHVTISYERTVVNRVQAPSKSIPSESKKKTVLFFLNIYITCKHVCLILKSLNKSISDQKHVFLCFILTFTKENVKHDEMNFLYIAFMFYTTVLIQRNFQLTTILFLNVLLLKKKPNPTV